MRNGKVKIKASYHRSFEIENREVKKILREPSENSNRTKVKSLNAFILENASVVLKLRRKRSRGVKSLNFRNQKS